MTGLAGTVAVVSGAASGVGARSVELFLANGASVVAADIDGGRLRQRFPETSNRLELVECDVRDEVGCSRLVSTSVGRFKRLDVLFNNAGVTLRAPIGETSTELWQEALAVNLTGAFFLVRAAVPHLRRGGGGAIVNNASINALRGNVDLVAYSAAKAGLVGLTRALAVELAPDGIRVNAICPGTIATPMTADYVATQPDAEQAWRLLAAKHPLGRVATDDDVARVAVFLTSPDSSFVTGAVVPVDGGRHIA